MFSSRAEKIGVHEKTRAQTFIEAALTVASNGERRPPTGDRPAAPTDCYSAVRKDRPRGGTLKARCRARGGGLQGHVFLIPSLCRKTDSSDPGQISGHQG